MCFISPKNVERKLENKEKKSNSKDSVTKLCFTADIYDSKRKKNSLYTCSMQ